MKILLLVLATSLFFSANASLKKQSQSITKSHHQSRSSLFKHTQHSKHHEEQTSENKGKWWPWGDDEDVAKENQKKAKYITIEKWKGSIETVKKNFEVMKKVSDIKEKATTLYNAADALYKAGDSGPEARVNQLAAFIDVVGKFTEVPLLGDFLDFYSEALQSVLPTIKRYYEDGVQQDRYDGRPTHEGVWPGRRAMLLTLREACSGVITLTPPGDEATVWLIDAGNAKELRYLTRKDPYKSTGWGFTRFQKHDRAHLLNFIKDHWQAISLLHYGLTSSDKQFCLCDRQTNCGALYSQ